MRPTKQRGYLLSILSVCVALLTVGYLSLAAYSARQHDSAKRDWARTCALYAAESGLVLAEQKLPELGPNAPLSGTWLSGKFSAVGSRFRVEIRPSDRKADHFIVVSTGEFEEEMGVKETAVLRAKIAQKKGKAWVIEWRSQ